MSVKKVTCPGCRNSMNVMASMATVKCPSCGQVFDANAPATSAAYKPPTTQQQLGGTSNAAAGKLIPWLIFGGVLFLAIGGIAVMTLTPQRKSSAPEVATQPVPEVNKDTGKVEIVDKPIEESGESKPEYEIVDLPESTRKKIFREYNAMMDSSFGKAKRIPKSGAAGQGLRSMLGGTVEREMNHMALIYGIEPEEILEIIAEGEDKGW